MSLGAETHVSFLLFIPFPFVNLIRGIRQGLNILRQFQASVLATVASVFGMHDDKRDFH